MVDLEDGVAPDAKRHARMLLADFMRSAPATPAYVRINDPRDEDGRGDLAMLTQHADRVQALIVPKATTSSLMTMGDVSMPVVALIETAAGVEDAADIARLPAVVGMLFGSVDYVADVSRHGGWHLSDLGWVQSRLVNAGASGGCWTLAGPCTQLSSTDGLVESARAERSRGFAGKLCIHPSQLDVVNDIFAPRSEDVAWARRVLDQTGGNDVGAVRVDGQMIDRPLLEHARRLVVAARGEQR